MELRSDGAEALRMGGELLAEMAWKRMFSQDGGLLGKGAVGEMQADWLAQMLAKEMGGHFAPPPEGSHGS